MSAMHIVFRVDSSTEMGSGHLMRCMTLANTLREDGAEVIFICRELPGNMIGHAESKGFVVHRMPAPKHEVGFQPGAPFTAWLGVHWQADAEEVRVLLEKLPLHDWLIIDNYVIDCRWEKIMRLLVKRIMVIDDLADRPHDCDLLLDQNLFENMESRYDGLVPDRCTKMLGLRYALLRPEFLQERQRLRKRDGTIRRILIFFGGSDPTNETAKALVAMQMFNRPNIAVDVVVGNSNPNIKEIIQLCNDLPACRYHCQVDNMAELLAAADLAIGAGGATTWERCCLGVPSIVLPIAHNQIATVSQLGVRGLIADASVLLDAPLSAWSHFIGGVITDPDRLKRMGMNGMDLVDGRGATRTARLLKGINGASTSNS